MSENLLLKAITSAPLDFSELRACSIVRHMQNGSKANLAVLEAFTTRFPVFFSPFLLQSYQILQENSEEMLMNIFTEMEREFGNSVTSKINLFGK